MKKKIKRAVHIMCSHVTRSPLPLTAFMLVTVFALNIKLMLYTTRKVSFVVKTRCRIKIVDGQ